MPDIEELFERLERLEGVASDFREWRSGVMVEHNMLKDGVANFKAFKERGTQAFDRADFFFDRFEPFLIDQEAQAKKQWKRSDKLAAMAILAVLILPPAGWVANRTVIFFSDLYQITQEWHTIHHSEIQEKKSDVLPDPVLSYSQKSQDARLPNMR